MTRTSRIALGAFASLAAAPATWAQTAPQLMVYASPPGKALYTYHNDDFTVRVRVPGGDWQDLYEYRVMVDLDDPQPASMVTFAMRGPVEVAVKKNNGDVRRVEIRPGSKGVQARLDGHSAYFTLTRPENLSVEFDGDRLHNLHLFANPIEESAPDKSDPNVVYFGPGIHELPEGQSQFSIGSGKTVYIAGGAIVKGQIDISNAHDVKVLGHGILQDGKEGLTVFYSKNVTIDGPIVMNPRHYTVSCGQSTGVVIANLRTFSAVSWGDGLDLMSCSQVKIDNVFLRTSDDAIAIYGDRWDFHGDARDYLITNSTLWADIAHPINIGLHGNKDAPRTVENLTFRNIDILGHDEDDRNYQGALAISNSDNNLVRNILFDSIRIDDIEEGMLFNFRVVFNKTYSLAPGRGIDGVTLSNISYKGGDINRSVMAGYDKMRAIRNITFQNVVSANVPLKLQDLDIGDFVDRPRILP